VGGGAARGGKGKVAAEGGNYCWKVFLIPSSICNLLMLSEALLAHKRPLRVQEPLDH